jgi:hypothetical protein
MKAETSQVISRAIDKQQQSSAGHTIAGAEMAVKMHFSHGDHSDPSGRLPDPKSDTSMGDASALVAQTPSCTGIDGV